MKVEDTLKIENTTAHKNASSGTHYRSQTYGLGSSSPSQVHSSDNDTRLRGGSAVTTTNRAIFRPLQIPIADSMNSTAKYIGPITGPYKFWVRLDA